MTTSYILYTLYTYQVRAFLYVLTHDYLTRPYFCQTAIDMAMLSEKE